MAFPESPTPQRRFSPTPLRVTAALLGLVLVVSVVLLVIGQVSGRDRASAEQGIPPSPSYSQQATSASTEASSCPDNEGSQDSQLTQAPPATWRYQEVTAFPVSPQFGPAVTTDVGRFCFQHSATGALFMAANAAAAGSSSSADGVHSWMERAVATGPQREYILARSGQGSAPGAQVTLSGFKILDYTQSTATVDLGFTVVSGGQTKFASATYLLTWQNNDWKIRSDITNVLTVVVVPDLAGFVSWGP